jgi:hypothetical protein
MIRHENELNIRNKKDNDVTQIACWSSSSNSIIQSILIKKILAVIFNDSSSLCRAHQVIFVYCPSLLSVEQNTEQSTWKINMLLLKWCCLLTTIRNVKYILKWYINKDISIFLLFVPSIYSFPSHLSSLCLLCLCCIVYIWAWFIALSLLSSHLQCFLLFTVSL